jgi:hypothetical protein
MLEVMAGSERHRPLPSIGRSVLTLETEVQMVLRAHQGDTKAGTVT